MEYTFFYGSIAVVVLIFILLSYYKTLKTPNILIGLVTIGFSLIIDILFGDRLKLFYYINPQQSTFYMVLAPIFIYAPLNVIYTLFLPAKPKAVILYTGFWIVGMAVFEYASLLTKAIVFTGWIMFPWSYILYIAAYLWIYFLYRYLQRKFQSQRIIKK